MEFFPPDSLANRPALHAFRSEWYVAHLLAMQEAPLFPPMAHQSTVYRLLFLPTFRRPSVVRLTGSNENWSAVCKRTDGLGGYHAGKLVSQADLELSPALANEFGQLLEPVAFWDMPSFEDCHGLDGSQAILEGMGARGYHVVDRWSPRHGPSAALVEFLLGLCPPAG